MDKHPQWYGVRFTLYSMLTVMLIFASAGSAGAYEFKSKTGEVSGSFDTTISIGSMWRMQDQDPALVGITNGGTSRSPNEDDGNLNYDRGDLVSGLVKVTHEFDVKYGNYGVFLRGYYFYDYAAARNKEELGPLGEDRLISEVKLLDAYGRASFDLGGRTLNVRAGNQVVSWGESTFIPNGINVINPVDVTRLRAPGAELRDAFIPTPMGWFSQSLADNTTVEGVYLVKWEKTEIDPSGSYFSTNDYISDDGDKVYIGFGRRNDQHGAAGAFPAVPTAQAWAPRTADREPGDSGQYGFAVRQFAPNLNNTEFGLFVMKYHSRTPFASGVRGGITVASTAPFNTCTVVDLPTFSSVLGSTGSPDTATDAACAAAAGRTATYFADYPENIKLYGASFNTSAPAGIALQGEYSYRPNQPVQLAAIELLLAAVGLQNNITGDATAAFLVPYGTEITGYRRVQMHQAQVTGTKAFGPTIGAEQFVIVAEVGYTYLNLPDGLLFSGPSTHLPAPGSANAANGSYQTEGYATKSSWGYRAVARMDFESALGGATLSPRIAYSHDVRGVSPTFNEGVKAVTVGLGYNLRQVWQADVAYTNYFGGRTYAGTDTTAVGTQPLDYASSANPLKDRDFISATVSYSF